jgi:hypothetical protein
MYKFSTLAAAGALTALMLNTQAFAQATFVPITPPEGAVDGGAAIGLNDKGEVAGSYSTDGSNSIGYVGTINGDYETFELDGNPTLPRGLNNQGRIVGFYFNVSENALHQFERTKNGTLTTITKDGTPVWGIAQGINQAGEFAGDYVGAPGSVPQRGGYQGKNAEWQNDVTLPFTGLRVAPRAINAKGDIAGWFVPESGDSVQGFVIKNGETTVVHHPDAVMTFVQGINNKGEISGAYEDADGNSRGFALDADLATWTTFDAPGMAFTQAWQINSHGQIAVSGFGDAGAGAFIYCPNKAGVCSSNKGKAGQVSTAKGKGGLNAPAPGKGNGPVDPDTAPRKNGHRK